MNEIQLSEQITESDSLSHSAISSHAEELRIILWIVNVTGEEKCLIRVDSTDNTEHSN